MTKFRNTRLQVYARDPVGVISASVDINVHTESLTPNEHKKVVSRLHRNIPKLFEGIPYSDFGIDNIAIRKRRA